MCHVIDRRGRLGRMGTVGLASFVAWTIGGRVLLDSGGSRPPLLLVGWQVILNMLELHGHALGAFRLAVAGLWLAVPAWAATDGFRYGTGWLQLVHLAVGTTGVGAAGPVLVALIVVALNVVLWAIVILVALLLIVAVLLRIVTAPFRRW